MTYRINASKIRSIALTGLIYVFTTNQLLCCFDELALAHKAGRKRTLFNLNNYLYKITYVR